MGGTDSFQCQQRKDANFVCHAQQFENRRLVKGKIQVIRIEKQQVRNERQVELIVLERHLRQSRDNVSALCQAAFEIRQKTVHGGQPALAQVFGIAKVGPDKAVHLLADLGNHVVMTIMDALLDFTSRERVNGIARDDVEASTVASALGWRPSPPPKCDQPDPVRKREQPIFVERSTRNDFVELMAMETAQTLSLDPSHQP